jgi:hypothetical protein
MWQAPSFAAKLSSARLGLAVIRKTALIAGIFVEDQGGGAGGGGYSLGRIFQ